MVLDKPHPLKEVPSDAGFVNMRVAVPPKDDVAAS